MKNVLFVHGVFHTTEIFDRLIKSLNDINCKMFYIPGLDDSEDISTKQQIELLKNHLKYNNYDLVVAHSYGAYLVLSVVKDLIDTKVLLLNPLCNNFKPWLNKAIPLFKMISFAKLLYKTKVGKRVLILLARLTCNDKDMIDTTMISGISMCTNHMDKLLSATKNDIMGIANSEIYMIWGLDDRLLNYPKIVASYCKEVVTIRCGHSCFIEREVFVSCKIKELIGVQ